MYLLSIRNPEQVYTFLLSYRYDSLYGVPRIPILVFFFVVMIVFERQGSSREGGRDARRR